MNALTSHQRRTMFVPRFLVVAFLGLISGLTPTGSLLATTIDDANADFVLNLLNPNGVWTYGYTTTLGGSFVTHAEYVDASGCCFGWRTNISGGAPGIVKMTANGFGALIGELTMHPGPNGQYDVLRFTAPVAGAYDVLASWRGPGNVGDTDLHLLLNSNSGSPLGSTNSTNTSGTIHVSPLLLNVGDTIDLSMGALGSFTSDTTPINLVITRVIPEPSSILLLSLGAVGLLRLRGARRSRPGC